MTDDTAIELGDMIRQVMMAVMEVRRAGSPSQLAAARRVLAEARRSMYRILAEDDTDEPARRHGHGRRHRQRRPGGRRMTEPVILVSDLVKRYGEVEAVRGIGFEVQPGETFGFLGPNGAGKSTTIKILCTLADPTSGTARVAGYDVGSSGIRSGGTSAWCSRTPRWTTT